MTIIDQLSTDGIFGRMSCREVFLNSLVTSIPEGVQVQYVLFELFEF